MSTHKTNRIEIPALPETLLDKPLEYFLADHARQRIICESIKSIAKNGQMRRVDIGPLLTFLTQDRLIHHADEERGLFPALQRRALPEDNLVNVLGSLSEDHRRSDMIVAQIAADVLKIDSDPYLLSDSTCRLMRMYTTAEARHLAIENGVVLVIAQIRLNAADWKTISDRMKERRIFLSD